MTQPDNYVNPFNREKTPSLTFANPGDSHTLTVTERPSLQQSRNFETGNPEVWPDGSPKQIILVLGTIASGEKRALWVTPGTALFAAVQKAQQDAGAEVAPGGTLSVTFTHTVPSQKGAHFHPAKQYSAAYKPGSAFGSAAPATAAPAATHSVAPQQPVSAAPTPVTTVPQQAPAAPAQQLTPEQYAALSAAGVDMSAFVALATG